MIVFTEKDIRQAVDISAESIAVVEEGFSLLAKGVVQTPPIMRIDIPQYHGEVDVKAAEVNGLEYFAVKLSSGFFNNSALGLPTGSGLMILLSARTGFPAALLLDNGYLTNVRTAAAGAIAARHLAPDPVATVAVIGAGAQARFQVQALRHVRKFSSVLVYARSDQRAHDFCRDIQELGIRCEPVSSVQEAVSRSDLVITATPAEEPIVQAEWLHPGLHITAMGSDAEYKQELDPRIFEQADKIVCDLKTQAFRLGELHHGLEAGMVQADHSIVELGEITSGKRLGRTRSDEITVCDLTGTGVQDTMIATYAYQALEKKGLGTRYND